MKMIFFNVLRVRLRHCGSQDKTMLDVSPLTLFLMNERKYGMERRLRVCCKIITLWNPVSKLDPFANFPYSLRIDPQVER